MSSTVGELHITPAVSTSHTRSVVFLPFIFFLYPFGVLVMSKNLPIMEYYKYNKAESRSKNKTQKVKGRSLARTRERFSEEADNMPSVADGEPPEKHTIALFLKNHRLAGSHIKAARSLA